MMRILLDTQVLLWAMSDDRRLGAAARKLLETPENEVFVSAASLWEISIKVSIGKLRVDPLEVLAAIPSIGFRELPVVAQHAVQVSVLPWHHRDPFDRILVAQAQVEPMYLLTGDSILERYGEFVIPAGR